MKWIDVLVIIGTVVAAPVAPLLFDSHQAVIPATVITIGIAMLVLRWWLHHPEFNLLLVEKVLTVSNATGRKATLIRNLHGKVTLKGLTEFWCRNIAADGTIVNIMINDEPPQKTIHETGDIHVGKRFPRRLRGGEKFSLQLSYELVDSFINRTGALIHVVESKTEKLRMIVMLPRERPAKSARASLRSDGQSPKKLPDPLLSGLNAGERVEIEIENPKSGAEYCLEWSW